MYWNKSFHLIRSQNERARMRFKVILWVHARKKIAQKYILRKILLNQKIIWTGKMCLHFNIFNRLAYNASVFRFTHWKMTHDCELWRIILHWISYYYYFECVPIDDTLIDIIRLLVCVCNWIGSREFLIHIQYHVLNAHAPISNKGAQNHIEIFMVSDETECKWNE